MENTEMNEETSDKKNRKWLWLLLALLFAFGLALYLGARPNTKNDLPLINITFRENPVKVSSFDNDQTRAKALINNIVVTYDGATLVIDSAKATITDGTLSYDDGELTISITNATTGGQADVTVNFKEETATSSFSIIVISPEPGKKGNIIDAPATVSEVREINVVTSETPTVENPDSEVANSDNSAVVKPEDVATPVHEPEPTVIPTMSYNKVSIAYEDGTKLSLFANGEGSKLVVLFKDGNYINYSTGNKVEFTVSETAQGVSFEMKEYDASNNIISICNAIYSK